MFNEHRGSVWDDERFLEVNSGGGYTSMGMYLMSQNWALKQLRDFHGGPEAKTVLPIWGAQVQAMVRELDSTRHN